MIVYRGPNGYSIATSQSLIAYNVTRAKAIAALSRIGADPEIINQQVDFLTWRATLTAALANESMHLSAVVDGMADCAETERLHDRLDILIEAADDIRDELQRANEIAEADANEKRVARETAEAEAQQQLLMEAAAAKEARRKAIEEFWRTHKVERFLDGTVQVVRPEKTFGKDGRPISVNHVIAKYAPGDDLPAGVKERLP